MRKSLILTGAALALAGCTMTPVYTRPDFPAAQTWYAGLPPVPAGAAVAARTGWRDFFAAPGLQRAIETALSNNRDLKQAALAVQEARALARIDRAALLPSVTAGGGASYTRTPEEASATGRAIRTEGYDAGLGLSSYEIDLFGRIRSGNAAAVSRALASEEAAAALRNSLIAETAQAWLAILADRDMLALAQDILDTQSRTLELLTRSREKGVATERDVARAAAAVEAAKDAIQQSTRQVAQDENALFLLLGVPRDDSALPEAPLDALDIRDALDPGLPADVLLARPDVRQAEYDLIARNADIGAARAAFFPSVTLTGTLGYASEGLAALFTGGAAGAWTFVPRITMPLFEGGRNKATLDLAEIRKEKAVLAYEQAIQSAFRDIADALAARATLDEQQAARQRLVDAAQKVSDISDARYEAGLDSLLDTLDDRRALYAARQDLIRIKRDRLANLVTLYRALGGGGG